MRKAKDKPKTIFTDSGGEFTNKIFLGYCKENNIKCFQSLTSTHAPFVERFNRTLKNKIYMFMDARRTERFIDFLQVFVGAYNSTVHRMIKMTPLEAEKPVNHSRVRKKMMAIHSNIKKRIPSYNVGQTVRTSQFPKKFQRGYEIQNQNEIFTINSINSKFPLSLYRIKSVDSEDIIRGSFYEFELTPTELDTFFIEKILKKAKNKVLVKWSGYTQLTWEPRAYIQKILKLRKS